MTNTSKKPNYLDEEWWDKAPDSTKHYVEWLYRSYIEANDRADRLDKDKAEALKTANDYKEMCIKAGLVSDTKLDADFKSVNNGTEVLDVDDGYFDSLKKDAFKQVTSINAVAGSGKTTKLAKIVDTYEGRYLYTCFNVEAKNLFLSRLCSESYYRYDKNTDCVYGGNDRTVDIRTVDSLALNILQSNADYIDNLDFKDKIESNRLTITNNLKHHLLEEADKNLLKELRFAAAPGDKKTLNDNQFKKFLNALDKAIVQDEPLDYNQRLVYHRLLCEGILNYHMIEKEACKVPSLGSYDYALIDEAQDLNPIQLNMLRRLDVKHWIYAGDPFQNIYAFNGSTPQALNSGDQQLNLRVNHRCSKAVVNFLNTITKRDELADESAPNGFMYRAAVSSPQGVMQLVRKICNSNTDHYVLSIQILCMRNIDVQAIHRQLKMNNLKHSNITVTTIYKAKGSESDIIIGYGMNDSEWSTLDSDESEVKVNRRNLLYTLCSRARYGLILCAKDDPIKEISIMSYSDNSYIVDDKYIKSRKTVLKNNCDSELFSLLRSDLKKQRSQAKDHPELMDCGWMPYIYMLVCNGRLKTKVDFEDLKIHSYPRYCCNDPDCVFCSYFALPATDSALIKIRERLKSCHLSESVQNTIIDAVQHNPSHLSKLTKEYITDRKEAKALYSFLRNKAKFFASLDPDIHASDGLPQLKEGLQIVDNSIISRIKNYDLQADEDKTNDLIRAVHSNDSAGIRSALKGLGFEGTRFNTEYKFFRRNGGKCKTLADRLSE